MKLLVVVLLGVFALTWATPVQKHTGQVPVESDTVRSQVELLFKYVTQPSYFKDHQEIAQTYKIEANRGKYNKPEYVDDFLRLRKRGALQRGQIFSEFYDDHLRQAIALFRILYYAGDYDTFYKTAVWARNHCNEGLYLYALSVALVQRPDTANIPLPPIYEIYPYYFYNSLVIQKAQEYKQLKQLTGEEQRVVTSNYTGTYLNLNPEQSLAYFTEDVRLNAFYYYYNLYYPFWLEGEDFKVRLERRGEQYYYLYQQLLARYYLERLSNGFGEIEFFNWELPFKNGYYPNLRYPNGLEFPTRPNNARLYEYFYNYGQRWSFKGKYGYSFTLARDYERRIRDLIDRGYVFKRPTGEMISLFSGDGFNTLGNLIECNADSPDRRFYGPVQIFARHLLGYASQPLNKHKLAPSALEHFETSLRDPAFYQLYKRILVHFQQYKLYLQPYTEAELTFPEVELKEVQVQPVETYYADFDADVTNAVYVTPEEFRGGAFKPYFKVLARQRRLTYNAFTYKLRIESSKKDDPASVRVFLGPKCDEYGRQLDLNENRLNFVQIDYFTLDLNAGDNVVERRCRERANYNVSKGRELEQSHGSLMRAVHLQGGQQGAADGTEPSEPFSCFFAPPRGTVDGQTFQLYAIVSPVNLRKNQQDNHRSLGSMLNEKYALGYPFDRHIGGRYFYQIPNARFQDMKIYYRKTEGENVQ